MLDDHLPKRNIAVLVDYENVNQEFLQCASEMLDLFRQRGKVLIRKAYADWSATGDKIQRQLTAVGYELVGLSAYRRNGKNAADIRLVVDALTIAHTSDTIDTFVVLTGDSDYIPMVVRLRELGRHVILVGNKDYLSESLAAFCDEVVTLSRWGRVSQASEPVAVDPFTPLRRCMNELYDGEIAFASVLKPAIVRLDPTFDEASYGHKRFGDYLRAAESAGVITLRREAPSILAVTLREGEDS